MSGRIAFLEDLRAELTAAAGREAEAHAGSVPGKGGVRRPRRRPTGDRSRALALATAALVCAGATVVLVQAFGGTASGPTRVPATHRPAASPSASARPGGVSSGPTGPSTGDRLESLAEVSATDVWAVGVRWSGGRGTSLIERWDGTRWTVAPSPNVGRLRSVGASGPDDAWAVSDEGLRTMHWDGRSWSVVPAPGLSKQGGYLTQVRAIAPDDAWAVGVGFTPGYRDRCGREFGGQRPLILHWDGVAWRVSPTQAPAVHTSALGALAIVSSNDAWAVGFLQTDSGPLCPGASGGRDRSLIEHWDGTGWSIVPSPNPATTPTTGNVLMGDVAALTPTDVWATGTFCPKGACYPMLLHWDGVAWSVGASGWRPAQIDHQPGSIVAFSDTDIWLGGDQDEAPILEHWDGRSLTPFDAAGLGAPGATGGLAVTGSSPDDLWAVGAVFVRPSAATPAPGPSPSLSARPSFVDVPAILHWDGRTWRIMTPAPGPA